MPAGNCEKYIQDAIKSILNQSFSDFELIIVDSGSTDETLTIVKSFCDLRICVIAQNDLSDAIQALNKGLESAEGKYVAIMRPDCIMHVDRLKIQHATMEAEPSVTVCSTLVKKGGNPKPPPGGLIENPLIAFLHGNSIIHPTVMMRKQFLTINKLQYENYPDVDDFKLWAEIAKRGGQFYIDTQTLTYCCVDSEQDNKKSESVINEIVEFLAKKSPELDVILAKFKILQDKEMMTQQDIVAFFKHFFIKNKEKI